jgi:hypothetical protein
MQQLGQYQHQSPSNQISTNIQFRSSQNPEVISVVA